MRVNLSRRIQSLLAALLLVCAPVLAVAGTPSSAAAAVVSRIDVQGNQRVDAGTIKAYLSTQPARSFSSDDEDASLKALLETGLFADVHIARHGSTLVATVVETAVIN